MNTALLLISILLSTCCMVFSEEVFADGHNFCCKGYLTKKDCLQSANYDCEWLNRTSHTGIPSDREMFLQFGAPCLGRKFIKCKRDHEDIKYRCFKGCGDLCTEPECEYAPFENINPECLIGYYDDQYEEDEQEIFANLDNAPSITKSSIDMKLFGSIAAILLIFGACFVYYNRKSNNDEKAKYSSIDALNYGTNNQTNAI